MKLYSILFFIVFHFTIQFGYSQAYSINKTFITDSLDFIKFINNSRVLVSLPRIGGKLFYKIEKDSLRILLEFTSTSFDGKDSETATTRQIKEWYNFKILLHNDDSLFLLSKFIGTSSITRVDTLRLINLSMFKDSIINFNSFSYAVSGNYQMKGKSIHIDSLGVITSRKSTVSLDEYKLGILPSRDTIGKFSTKEFQNFQNILSYAQLSKKPRKQYGCGYDPVYTSYNINFNNKTISWSSCNFSSFHYLFLEKYLYDLNENPGVIKK